MRAPRWLALVRRHLREGLATSFRFYFLTTDARLFFRQQFQW